MKILRYSELSKLPSFRERYEYLKLGGSVASDTFAFDRYLNQIFYRSPEWQKVRRAVILRDNGNDLGVDGYTIYGKVIVHHMNPLRVEDITERKSWILDPEFLITTQHDTHNAIHYSDESMLAEELTLRTPNDTCPWR